jgi:hypothetical protein
MHVANQLLKTASDAEASMKRSRLLLALVALFAIYRSAVSAEECSTEKVNRDCTVTIDRFYPVALPTIQMRKGQLVHVVIRNPFPFETLTLDLQSAQALAGTDQTAGFVTGALPQLKGSLVQTTYFQQYVEKFGVKTADGGEELESIKKYREAYASFSKELNSFVDDVSAVYSQINEVISPISPLALKEKTQRLPGATVKGNVPLPWKADKYQEWKDYLTCEMTGETCDLFESSDTRKYPEAEMPQIRNLLARAALLNNKTVATCPDPKPPDPAKQPLVCYMNAVKKEISALPQEEQSVKFGDYLKTLDRDSAVFAADNTSIIALIKDLSIYYANIKTSQNMALVDPISLGTIPDPLDQKVGQNVNLPKFLGRQVVFSLNAVNEVGTFAASVPGSSAKKSILTITVLYADPIFEASGGVFFSTLPNRSFANVTMISGDPPVLGDVVITQTISRPTIVPFAGANWRLLPTFAWPDRRRGAVYITGAVGLNANNAMIEFGAGPSISWRAVMFSTLYHWGHDVRLTQNEYVGQIWCNVTAAHGNIPKCSGSPPAPTTEKYWTGAFGFGVSVRIPSVFSAAGK